MGVRTGDNCRLLGLTLATFGTEPYLITLGKHVTVTSGVKFVTHDGAVWVFRDEYPDMDVFGPIVVEDNVFIGFNSIILPGVRIGHDSVIGAGSVVTRSIPPRSVAAGVPAKVIKSIDEYQDEVNMTAMHIRSLPPAEKRRLLTLHFYEQVRSKQTKTKSP
ncbi:MAG: acyltransferase [Candidatus Bathyarchaeia archaeon]